MKTPIAEGLSTTPTISNILNAPGRTCLEEHGLSVSELIQEGTEFRVTKAELAYRSAAVYGETLVVGNHSLGQSPCLDNLFSYHSRTRKPASRRRRLRHTGGSGFQRQNQTHSTTHIRGPEDFTEFSVFLKLTASFL